MSINTQSLNNPIHEKSVLSGELKINIVEWGEADAPVIIMLHGLRAYARTWNRVALALADRYRIVALDQRGRGKSDWGPSEEYFTPNYVSDLKNVVDALGLKHFILLGHSMGGATALVFSSLYSDYLDGLIIEDIGPGSSAGSDGADRIRDELNHTPRTFETRAQARSFWRDARPSAPDEAIEERLDHMMIEDDDGQMRWRYDLEGIAKARLDPDVTKIPDLWPPISKLSVPTLVLRGENSDFLPLKVMAEMSERNPNISAHEISGASHYIHDDNFDEFMMRLEAFLAALSQTDSVADLSDERNSA
jgi:pimeloyl-ACP methyl ester carboxylesterase